MNHFSKNSSAFLIIVLFFLNCYIRISYQINPTIKCLPYQFVQSQVCQNCYYTCQTCDGFGSSKCTSCNQVTNRILVNSQCQCQTSYFEKLGQSTCFECHNLCQTCFESTSNSCLSCKHGFELYKNTCTCPVYQFLNLDTMECQLCHFTCQLCNGSSSSDCLKCSIESLRTLQDQQCKCSEGYFDQDGIQICQKCSSSCLTCDSKITCLSCQSDKMLINGQCICQTQQFLFQIGLNQINSNTDYQLCQSNYFIKEDCHPRCDKCYGPSLNECIDCPNLSHLIGTSCYCNNGYFYSNNICTSCNTNCQTCQYNANNCTTCQNNYYMSPSNSCCHISQIVVNKICICPTYTFNNNGICQNCPNNCNYCDISQCLSCINQQYYGSNCNTLCQIAHCEKCDINGSCIKCKDSYINNGTSCSCQSNITVENYTLELCIDCGQQFTNCSQCNSSGCISCNQGYFVNGGLCQSCIQNCISCTNSTTCDTCDTSFFGSNCQACHISCYTCSGASYQNCLSCKSNFYFQDSICYCSLNYQYLDTSNNCQICKSTCNGCQNQYNECTGCYFSNQHRILDTTNKQCICDTQNEYYDIGYDICQNISCGYGCQICDTINNTCSNCLTYQTNRTDDVNLNCVCKEGYYENQSAICFQCPYQCKACYFDQTDNTIKCLICKDKRILPTCHCIEGYYQSGQSCLQCPINCITCISNTFCTSCVKNYNLYPQSLTIQKCSCFLTNYYKTDCTCLDGYYLDNFLYKCLPCNYKCSICIYNSQNCIKCQNQYFQEPNCICANGFYEHQGECFPCREQCSKCSSSTNCLDCPSMLILYKSQCICPQNYYNLPNSYECLQCSPQCLECRFNSNNCLICNFNRINPQICNCPNGTYEINDSIPCENCSIQCLTCEISSDNCTVCSDNRGFPPSCNCLIGYFEDQNKICQSCHFKCFTCQDTFDNCTSCIPLTKSIPTCECSDGYFLDNITKQCNQCNSKCQTCIGPNEYNCLSCYEFKQMTLQYGKCICQSNYYFDGNQCQLCTLDILQCQPNYCGDGIKQSKEECDDWNNLNRDGCSSQCILEDEYYCKLTQNFEMNNLLYTTCIKCPIYCIKCQNSKCIQCQQGYYISEIYDCQPCDIHCSFCSGSKQKDCTICKTGYDYGFKDKCAFCEDTIGLYTSNEKCISRCGDGIKKKDEECDDGNIINDDGCSQHCTIEKLDFHCSQQEDTISNCYKLNRAMAIVQFNVPENIYQSTRIGLVTFSKPLYISNSSIVYLWTQQIENTNQSNYNLSYISNLNAEGYLISLELTIKYFKSVEQNIYSINFTQYIPNDAIEGYQLKTIYVEYALDKFILIDSNIETTTSTSMQLGYVALYTMGSVASICFIMGNFDSYWNVLDNLQILSYISFINVNFPYMQNEFLSIFNFARFEFTNDYVRFDVIQNIEYDKYQYYPLILQKDIEYNLIINFSSIVLIWIIPIIMFIISKITIFIIKQITMRQSLQQFFLRIKSENENQKKKIIVILSFPTFQFIYMIQKICIGYIVQFYYLIVLRIYLSSLYDLNFFIFTTLYCWNWTINPNLVDNLSLIFAILLIFVQIIISILLTQSISSKPYQIKTKAFDLLFGSLYEGINSKKQLNRQFLSFQPIRKMIFMGALILFYDSPIYQITILIVLQFISAIISIIVQPRDDKFNTIKDIIQDIGLSISLSFILIYYFQDKLQYLEQDFIEMLSYVHVGIYILMLSSCLIIDLFQQSIILLQSNLLKKLKLIWDNFRQQQNSKNINNNEVSQNNKINYTFANLQI